MLRTSFVTVLLGSRALLREGLARILSAADFVILASVSRIDEVPRDSLPQDQPILLIVDVSNDESATIRQIGLIKEQLPNARIALLADHDQLSEGNIVAAFRAGAHAYFTKPSCDTFLKSLELVMLGDIIMPTAIMSFMVARREDVAPSDFGESAEGMKEEGAGQYAPKLSAREICILRCLIAGDSNKVIARNNAIAEATVKVHVKAILRKIRVNNRTQAAIWAMHHDPVFTLKSGSTPPAASLVAEPSFHRELVRAPVQTPRNGLALSLSSVAQGSAMAQGMQRVGPPGVDT